MHTMPIGMILVLLLFLVEMSLASKWSLFYFNNGIQLYSKVIRASSTQDNIDDLKNVLNTIFKGTGFSPSILFQKIDGQTIAFREKIFEFSLFSYTPLMHGKIKVDNSSIKISGLANWYPIGFLCLWYSFLFPTFRFDIDIIFLIAPVFIFGVIYIMQSRRYNKIASRLAEMK